MSGTWGTVFILVMGFITVFLFITNIKKNTPYAQINFLKRSFGKEIYFKDYCNFCSLNNSIISKTKASGCRVYISEEGIYIRFVFFDFFLRKWEEFLMIKARVKKGYWYGGKEVFLMCNQEHSIGGIIYINKNRMPLFLEALKKTKSNPMLGVLESDEGPLKIEIKDKFEG